MKTYPYMDGDRLIELVERRELDAAQLENDRLKVLIARLHRAISLRMSANEPNHEERLESVRAWREAGAVLDQITAMRDAIEEAETSLTDIAEYWNQDENESAMADACWHAVGTAKKALKKLQPFLTKES